MKKLVLIVLLGLVGVLLYKAYFSSGSQSKKKARPRGVVEKVVDSGRDVGRGAAKAFDSVDFGGKD